MKSVFPTLLLAFFSFFFPEEVNRKKNKDANSNNKQTHLFCLVSTFSQSNNLDNPGYPFLASGRLARENSRFTSLFAAGDVSSRNVLSGEERGETAVFAGYFSL